MVTVELFLLIFSLSSISVSSFCLPPRSSLPASLLLKLCNDHTHTQATLTFSLLLFPFLPLKPMPNTTTLAPTAPFPIPPFTPHTQPRHLSAPPLPSHSPLPAPPTTALLPKSLSNQLKCQQTFHLINGSRVAFNHHILKDIPAQKFCSRLLCPRTPAAREFNLSRRI